MRAKSEHTREEAGEMLKSAGGVVRWTCGVNVSCVEEVTGRGKV